LTKEGLLVDGKILRWYTLEYNKQYDNRTTIKDQRVSIYY
jgi:hypothetical protein